MISPTPLELVSARDFPTGDLYNLIESIYASSDYFSEAFADRYPSPGALTDELASPSGEMFWVAVLGDIPVGYIQIVRQSPQRLRHTAFLNMGVTERARGKGVGKRMLEGGVERVKGDVEILYLMVRRDNERAVRLYESAGFETISVLERDTKIEGRYYDGVLMRRFLT